VIAQQTKAGRDTYVIDLRLRKKQTVYSEAGRSLRLHLFWCSSPSFRLTTVVFGRVNYGFEKEGAQGRRRISSVEGSLSRPIIVPPTAKPL